MAAAKPLQNSLASNKSVVARSAVRHSAAAALLLSSLVGQAWSSSQAKPTQLAPAPAQRQQTISTERTLHFPTSASLGSIYLIPIAKSTAQSARDQPIYCGTACGTLKLKVPPDKMVKLALNVQAVDKPLLLREVDQRGIDALRLEASDMEERDSNRVGRVIAEIARFTNLTSLDLDRSEVKDADLKCLKPLTKLKSLSLIMTLVDGSFLKELTPMRELSTINLNLCALKGKNMAYLAAFPMLQHLNCNQTGFDASGTKNLQGCKTLQSITFSENPTLNDTALGYLKNLKNLERLDVRHTAVTLDGIAQLKTLPLTQVIMAGKIFPRDKIAQLKILMPKTLFLIAPMKRGSTHTDDMTIFAPMH